MSRIELPLGEMAIDGKLRAVVTIDEVVFSAEDVRRYLNDLIAVHITLADFCRKHDLSEEFVRQVSKGQKPPGGRLLDLLGIERRTYYCRKPDAKPAATDDDPGSETGIIYRDDDGNGFTPDGTSDPLG